MKADSKKLTGVSCTSSTSCVAVDGAGKILFSSDPAHTTAPWPVVFTAPAALSGVSCVGTTLCVAVGDAGAVAWSVNPGKVGTWNLAHPNGKTPLRGVSCTATSLCVAVGNSGTILTSTSLSKAKPVWSVRYPSGRPWFVSVSCPSNALCVALENDCKILASTKPTGSGSTWRRVAPECSAYGDAYTTAWNISCASVSLCSASYGSDDGAYGADDVFGWVVTSSKPTTRASWRESDPGGEYYGLKLTTVTCVLASLCVAGEEDRAVYVSVDPTDRNPDWSYFQIGGEVKDYPPPHSDRIPSISCPTDQWCLGAVASGNVFVGSS